MTKLLIKNAKAIITMDETRNRYENCDLLIEDNKIVQIAHNIDVAADEMIDATNQWVFPGMINTHHHFYQTFTRNIPEIQEAELFKWLQFLYPIWSKLNHEVIYYSSLVAMGELLKTGCTTSSDHFYVFPQAVSHELIDQQFRAASDIGMRFHGARGSMNLSKKDGGLPPDEVVQTVDEILKDSERAIKKFHNPDPFSMNRVLLAPCSPFSVTEEMMAESIKLARKFGVQSHTHLAETMDEERFCIERFGLRPLDYMKKVGWIGNDVWFAHGIYFNKEEIKLLADTQTGVAHCPVSNMKLGSGICKVPELMDANVPVGLAVDGSASNDSSNMLTELRSAYMIHRVASGVESMSAERALSIATNGGSRILNQPEIGSLEVGKAADLFMVNSNRLGFAGGQYDPVSALVTCGNTQIVDTTIVNGKVVVKEGQLVNVDENLIIEKANKLSKMMVLG